MENGLQSGSIPMPRADAERNRIAILDAARQLFAERGVEAVSMDDVAAAAGVGKGTLYRRVGDRAGLALALLDEEERRLQEAIVRGPPPLGPGAPPGERLAAFVTALLNLTERHLDLVVASETGAPGARFRTGVYAAWRAHVSVLLREARETEDVGALPDVLLAPLAGDLHRHLRREAGLTHEQLREAVLELAAVVAADRTPG
jgi:AcrR family transcriptional regulator